MKTPVWVFDTDHNRIAYANEAACAIWQAVSEEELKERDLSIGMSSTVANRLIQFQADFVDYDSEFSEFWTIFPRGEPVTVKVLCTGFVMPDGRMAMLAEMIGSGQEEPETLRSIEALLHTDVMIGLFSIDGFPLHLNPAARNAMPEGIFEFRELFCQLEDFLRMQSDLEACSECQIVAKMNTSGGSKWIDLSVKGCLDAVTGHSALLVTGVDVSELKITRDKARFLASRDQLTGCYNRAFMQMEQDRIIADCETGDARHALLFLDIDRFKLVNDSFGHEVGDMILQTFALRVQAQLQDHDVLARMGGDEFVVLIRDLKDQDTLHEKVEAMRRELIKPVDCGSVELSVTASIGVSVFESAADGDWSDTMKQADIALYHSKRSGRNCYTVFGKALGAEVLERRWLETEIKKAIEEKQFTLYFQPRLDTKRRQVFSVEA
ncbi:MAG: diguanylate cyclase, partial [Hyphomicrobiales bacterium]